MDHLLAILGILAVVMVSGCVSDQPAPGNGDADSSVPDDSVTPPATDPTPPATELPSKSEVIDECDFLCKIDKDAYCLTERTILINDKEVTGTCRAFARKDNVAGFSKCQGFCQEFGEDSTICTVDGKKDIDCDGNA